MSSLQAIDTQNVKHENTIIFSSEQESHISKSTLLELPGEIRNSIWRYSAKNERIQLPKGPQARLRTPFRQVSKTVNRALLDIRHNYNRLLERPTSTPTKTASASNPNFGLLCTNKQIYKEFYVYYWTLNTFFLPHGDLSHTLSFFSSIAPEHKAMVKHMGVHFTIADLTPQVIKTIESMRTRPVPKNYDSREWANIASLHLGELWGEKSRWLEGWMGLKSIVLLDAERRMLVLDESGRDKFSGKDNWDLMPEGVGYPKPSFMAAAKSNMEMEITLKIESLGWKGLKKEVRSFGVGL